jgi:hypothetical protein
VCAELNFDPVHTLRTVFMGLAIPEFHISPKCSVYDIVFLRGGFKHVSCGVGGSSSK